jgi:hypothetical protein
MSGENVTMLVHIHDYTYFSEGAVGFKCSLMAKSIHLLISQRNYTISILIVYMYMVKMKPKVLRRTFV